MAADDFQNNPADQGFPADSDAASAYSGNRPASGARRATPGEVLSQGFLGAQNAGDFLGLDVEFAGQDPNQLGGLDLVPPPTTQPQDPSMFPAEALAPAPLPDGDPVQEFAEAPSAFEFGEDLGSDEGGFSAEPEEERASSRKPALVAALFVAVLAAAGVFYGPKLYQRAFGTSTQVAGLPKPGPSQPRAKGGDAPATPDGAPSATQGEAVVPVPDPELATPGTIVAEKPTPSPRYIAPTQTGEPESTLSVEPGADDVVDGEDAAEIQSATGLTPVRPPDGSFPDLFSGEYAWASVDQLELIWRGAAVPLEAVRAPAKTLMPKVGNVRVFTTTGDVFDGRLYAVGQNRVWIDAEPGRIGLDGDKVERIEVIPPLPEGHKGDPALAVGGKHVRVSVPGGMIAGRVLKTEGDEVTLALDDGGRVRVKSADVQELGPGRAIVVRR